MIGEPPEDGASVTVTFAGGIESLGKPLPVTEITEMPAWPADGAAVEVSVTDDCARAETPRSVSRSAEAARIARQKRVVGLVPGTYSRNSIVNPLELVVTFD